MKLLRRVVCCGAFASLSPLAGHALAATTQSFVQTTVEDFEEGEATGTLVAPPGQVEVGLKPQRFPVDAAFLWASTVSPDGKTTYFGTGDPGRVYSVPAAGGAARLVASLPEPWVTALVVEDAHTLLAATTPGAKLYRINLPDGKAKEVAHLDTEHVWALVHDQKAHLTYAATGVTGKVAVIDAQAKVKTLWSADDQHLVSLLPDGHGGLLAGSAEKAILFRVGTNGQARALADFESQEVRAIALVGDTIFAAVNNFESGGGEDNQSSAKDKGAKGIALVTGGSSPAAPGKLPRPGAPKAKGAVYRIEPEGAVESVLTLSQGYFTSLLADKAGNVFAAAGSEGKVYRIDAQRNTSLVLDLPERQALTLVPAPSGFLVGSGDAGAVFAAQPAGKGEARYLSKVFDAGRFAKWGQLRFGAAAGVALQTRSGNTAKPDATWDPWTPLGSPAFAGAQGEGRVASAPARYVQYRADLAPKSILRDVTLFYRPQNLRARITDMTVADPPSPDRSPHSSLLKLRFKVENADNDGLVYRLAYKREADTLWRPLASTAEPLTKPEYDWNTEAVPDGEYVVRAYVTDAAAVYQPEALDFTFTSSPVLVDNTRPSITGLSSTAPTLTGRAVDAASPITAIDFQIDGGPWQSAAPKDGLLDQKDEAFSVRLPPLAAGDHAVAVRTFDAANNVGVAAVVVNSKGP